MQRKTKSWSGSNYLKSSRWSEAGAESSNSQRNSTYLNTGVLPTESQTWTTNGNEGNAQGPAPNPTSPDEKASRRSTVVSEDAKVNGDSDGRGKRRQSNTEEKEARLRRLRWRNLTTRAAVAEKRRGLHHARLEITHADQGFMKLVREMRTQQSDGRDEDFQALEEHYRQLQAARDKYGPLEESYNALEERLDREEYEITKLEERLREGQSDIQSQLDESDALSSAFDDDQSEGRVLIESDDYTLYDEYLSRQGDADMVREDIAELRFEYQMLQEARMSRRKVGHQLSPEDQAIWDNFFTKEAVLSERLEQIELDVERLRIQCIEAGLMPEEEQSDESEGEDILEDAAGSTPAEYERFPLLLEQPNGEMADGAWNSLITDFDPEDPGDRVERWLLHKLRSSCSEVELLARISASDGLGPFTTTEKWQEEVLEFWFLDSTVLPPSAYQVQDTVSKYDIPTSPFADKNNVSLFKSGQAQLFHLVIRSSSIFNKIEFALLLRLTIPRGEAAKSVR